MNGFFSVLLTQTVLDKALQVFWALVLFIGGWILIKIALNIVKKALAKTNLDEALHKFIINTVKIVLWVLLAITMLGYLNIPTSTCGAGA